MSFTSIGKIIAHLFFWYGSFTVVFYLYHGLSASEVADVSAALKKYMADGIGEGMNRVFYGVALGVLCEITTMRNRPEAEA